MVYGGVQYSKKKERKKRESNLVVFLIFQAPYSSNDFRDTNWGLRTPGLH